jgi:low affinity Fe/Cu permease
VQWLGQWRWGPRHLLREHHEQACRRQYIAHERFRRGNVPTGDVHVGSGRRSPVRLDPDRPRRDLPPRPGGAHPSIDATRYGSGDFLTPVRNAFNRAADRATVGLGSVAALILSVVVVIVWALTGPLFKFSDTWQLAINTGTTVVTFWMVFVIQNSQNRASKAVQLKLDEVIRALDGAENKFIRLEAATEGVLNEREAEMNVLSDHIEATEPT